MKFNAKLFFERLKSKVVQIYVHKKKIKPALSNSISNFMYVG